MVLLNQLTWLKSRDGLESRNATLDAIHKAYLQALTFRLHPPLFGGRIGKVICCDLLYLQNWDKTEPGASI